MHIEHLRKEVIRPTLHKMDLWSEGAEILLLATAAVESEMGHFLVQVGGGPALGIYQMEPATHDDIWHNYVNHRSGLRARLIDYFVPRYSNPSPHQMIGDLRYATAMARLQYRRFPEPIPNPKDANGMWEIYKLRYNTHLGATRRETFMGKWKRYIEFLE